MDMPMEMQPHKITKPFQLLASWVFGMVLVVWEFIYASLTSLERWQKMMYSISSIIFGIIFIAIIFLLQTKFRPEMQDSEHYQQIWMERYNKELSKTKPIDIKEILKQWKK